METSPTQLLVIDDDELLGKNIAVYLEGRGMVCYRAYSGTEGLELFRREQPDLVLLDIQMPGMSGAEMLEIIVNESPETPAIVISAATDPADVAAAFRLGAWDYLIKPITGMSILTDAIRRAIERAPLPTLATRPYGRTVMAPAFPLRPPGYEGQVAKASEDRRCRFGALLPYRMALSSTPLRQLLAHLPRIKILLCSPFVRVI